MHKWNKGGGEGGELNTCRNNTQRCSKITICVFRYRCSERAVLAQQVCYMSSLLFTGYDTLSLHLFGTWAWHHTLPRPSPVPYPPSQPFQEVPSEASPDTPVRREARPQPEGLKGSLCSSGQLYPQEGIKMC